MKNTILKSFVGGLIFFFTIFLCFVGYAAWINLTEVLPNDNLTDSKWNEMVTKLNSVGNKVETLSNIPSGFIGSFYLTSCPTGWKIADGTSGTPDLRGAFIRANVTSSTYDPDYAFRTGGLGDANKVGSSQGDAFQGHWHESMYSINRNINSIYDTRLSNTGENSIDTNKVRNPVSDGTNGNPRTSSETRPKNVALLYCMKE